MRWLALALLLTGCATKTVLLHHPDTGATARCGGAFDPTPLFPSVSGQSQRDRVCVEEHRLKGYVVVDPR